MSTVCHASWNCTVQSFRQLLYANAYFFLKRFEGDFVTEAMTLMLWAQKFVWKPGFGEQDSLDCILENQDPLESFCPCPRFQVRFLPYPSLYGYEVLFVFSSPRFCCYLWRSLSACSTPESAVSKLRHPSLKPIYTSSHLINFILFFLLLLRFRVTKDLGLPYF